MTRRQALVWIRARLAEAGFSPAQAEAESRQLLAWALKVEGPELWLGANLPLEPAPRERIEAALARRLAGEPLQLVLGSAVFYGLELALEPGVLVPRPETEGLVERALALLDDLGAPNPRVLDVGTGSGAIALALKHARPAARLLATDTSPVAVRLARENARRLGLEIEVRQASLTGPYRELDLIVANPPYLPTGYRARAPRELAWEPDDALYAGPDGLAVARPLAHRAAHALRPGGALALELDPGNVALLAEEAERLGFRELRIEADLSGRPRYLLARRG
ncbi:peptide chain release factor N(5)-glutamine methyltransferase [Oceanithermus sp.]|uniref:peptide chain release factor N(5)-glutamine methyltransferase n=1 Tax=Oceanithermus sp. TaxID=2268145 RepID=UPI0025EF7334|nr:peptide chain release factor N(5)-glutamine methyltransferase [Oceanithermus sp.]